MNTLEEKVVAEYCNVSLLYVYEFNIFEFYYYLREAVIYNYSQTEEGRKYLKKCWRLEQTEADIEGLRENFGKEDKDGR